MTVAALVPAAGSGVRMAAGTPKALLLLAGEPLLVHAVRGLRRVPRIGVIVVAVPPGRESETAALLRPYDVEVVPGGAERSDSVRAALAILPIDVDLVLVHDAARALAPPALADRILDALDQGADAVVPVLPVADTVKRVEQDVVRSTVDRSDLLAVQTPQGFRREVLEQAHRQQQDATDDAALVELLGRTVRTVPGAQEAFKVTRPFDLLVAEAVLRG
ncbi:MAG: 2-C-methyl-D-erythritol 4-phosphate cytidylyltransferase [Actinobacteria bacterium]|nr:2-C-methyl-D-erythritol 4-phosphate cytidylyltransferase [Actinomycetota bacterium]MCA1720035.1 2-C-methyl-D-erythritol 4-phosphate cytidylyltransferase [Actinomycetota bacterium]